jgi:hypothetical protein
MNPKGLLGAAGGAVLAIGLASAGPAGAAAGETASIQDGTLVVSGGSGRDVIVLRSVVSITVIEVDFGDDGVADATFDRTAVERIEVSGGSQDDVIRVEPSVGAFNNGAIHLDGGSGADVIDGNLGLDTSDMGTGSDIFRWDPGDGSDTVDGGTGRDTMDFNGAGAPEAMALQADGERALFTRDLGNIRMDMDGVERLDLDTLGGQDVVTVGDMTGTDFRQADVNLLGSGSADANASTVVVNGTAGADDVEVDTDGDAVVVDGLRVTTTITNSEAARDKLLVNTLDGNDAVGIGGNVANLIQVIVDLGPGES